MASPGYDILVTVDERFANDVDPEWIGLVAGRALESESVPAAELGVLVTDDETVQRLNRDYAGQDTATDVLSFSLREGEEFVLPPEGPDSVLRLGEVIISHETAVRQAREAGRPLKDEIAHLLVHGVLHLLGYDHADPEEERQMRAREQALLGFDAW
jgi:probable rRNA maturation factor